MVKGKNKAAAGSRAGSVAREILKRRDKPFRTDKSKKQRPSDQAYAKQAPTGYTFLPVGTPDLAELCKDLSKQRQTPIYVVNNKRKGSILADPTKVSHHLNRLGYYFDSGVVSNASKQLGYVLHQGQFLREADLQAQLAQSRIAKTMAKHGLKPHKPTASETPDKVGAAIRELFPNIPQDDLEAIVAHAWAEGSSRIGTIQDVSLARRVQLAVISRIRHAYTDYDSLLHAFGHWAEARQTVEPECLRKLIEWRGENALGDDEELHEIVRETIVIPDEDDEPADSSSEAENEDLAEQGEASDASVEITHRLAADEDLRAETVDEATRRWHGRSRLRHSRQMEDYNNIARQKIGDMRRMIREAPPSAYRPGHLQVPSNQTFDRVSQAVSVHTDVNGEAPATIIVDGQVYHRGPSTFVVSRAPHRLPPHGQPMFNVQPRHSFARSVPAHESDLRMVRQTGIASYDHPIPSIEQHDGFQSAPQTPPASYNRRPLHIDPMRQPETPDFGRVDQRQRLDPSVPGPATHAYHDEQQQPHEQPTAALYPTRARYRAVVDLTSPQQVHHGDYGELREYHRPIDRPQRAQAIDLDPPFPHHGSHTDLYRDPLPTRPDQNPRAYDAGPQDQQTEAMYRKPVVDREYLTTHFDEREHANSVYRRPVVNREYLRTEFEERDHANSRYNRPVVEREYLTTNFEERDIRDTEAEEYDPTRPLIHMSRRNAPRPMHRSDPQPETYLSRPDAYRPQPEPYLPRSDPYLSQPDPYLPQPDSYPRQSVAENRFAERRPNESSYAPSSGHYLEHEGDGQQRFAYATSNRSPPPPQPAYGARSDISTGQYPGDQAYERTPMHAAPPPHLGWERMPSVQYYQGPR